MLPCLMAKNLQENNQDHKVPRIPQCKQSNQKASYIISYIYNYIYNYIINLDCLGAGNKTLPFRLTGNTMNQRSSGFIACSRLNLYRLFPNCLNLDRLFLVNINTGQEELKGTVWN